MGFYPIEQNATRRVFGVEMHKLPTDRRSRDTNGLAAKDCRKIVVPSWQKAKSGSFGPRHRPSDRN